LRETVTTERLELLERFVDRIAEYFDYTHDDVNELEILRSIQAEATRLHNPDRTHIHATKAAAELSKMTMDDRQGVTEEAGKRVESASNRRS
jgi:hypothetical protein